VSELEGANEELSSTLAARKELGPEYDRALVEGFLSRVERAIDERVDRRLHGHAGASFSLRPVRAEPRPRRSRLLPLGSIVLAIPITAVAGSNFHGADGVVVMVVSWVGIVAVNAAHAFGWARQSESR